MKKTYIVRLTDEERDTCLAIVKKLKGTSQKVRRANILLKTDVDGPNWKDQQIADAFLCSRQSVENVRKKLVTDRGVRHCLERKKTRNTATEEIIGRKTGSPSHCVAFIRSARRPKRLDVTITRRKSRRTGNRSSCQPNHDPANTKKNKIKGRKNVLFREVRRAA